MISMSSSQVVLVGSSHCTMSPEGAVESVVYGAVQSPGPTSI